MKKYPIFIQAHTYLKREWLQLVFLFGIIIIAASIRLFALDSIPNGFHSDEVLNGYVGGFIVKNGVDIYGNKLPILYFNNFGDYPNVLPMYLSGIFVTLFGSTMLMVRLPIAIAGILTVIAIYFFCRWLFLDRWVSAITALILALLPWHVILSRATAENITASLFFIVGIFIIFVSIERQKSLGYLIGYALLLITYLLYPSQRIIVPLALLPTIFLATTRTLKVTAICAVISALILTSFIASTDWGRGRFEQTSIFHFNNVIQGKTLAYSTGLGENKILQARTFHNKILLSGLEFSRQYFSYISPEFYFSDIAKPQRYMVFENGVGYYTIILLIGTAIILQFSLPLNKQQIAQLFNKGRLRFWLCLVWIFVISPIPASLTLDDAPNIHRSLMVGISLMFIIAGAIAVIRSHKLIGRKVILPITIAILAAEVIIFCHYYFSLVSLATTTYRSSDQNGLARWLLTTGKQYSNVYVPDGDAIAFHYLFQKNDYAKKYAGQFSLGAKISSLDGIEFVSDRCPEKLPYVIEQMKTQPNSILVSRAECETEKKYLMLQEIGAIKRYDNLDAYKLFVLRRDN